MVVVLCNCPPDFAPTLARDVVERGLAACVNLLPGVTSVYRWEGDVCEDVETTLLIKTSDCGVDALRGHLLAAHPYDVPEVVVLPVDDARSAEAYVQWVRRVTTG